MKNLREIGDEIFDEFMELARENGYNLVAGEIQRILDENGWDCLSDIPVIVSEAYQKFGKYRAKRVK